MDLQLNVDSKSQLEDIQGLQISNLAHDKWLSTKMKNMKSDGPF